MVASKIYIDWYYIIKCEATLSKKGVVYTIIAIIPLPTQRLSESGRGACYIQTRSLLHLDVSSRGPSVAVAYKLLGPKTCARPVAYRPKHRVYGTLIRTNCQARRPEHIAHRPQHGLAS